MPSRKLTIIGLVLLAFAGILAAFFLGLNTLLREPRIHGFILGQISEVTGYVFEAGSLELGLEGGLGITAKDVKVSSKDRPETLAVSTVKISLELRELFRLKIIPSRLHLTGFRLDLGDYRALLQPSETPLPQIPFHRLLMFPLIQGEEVEISFQQDPLRLRHVNFEIVREGLTASVLNIRAGGIMLYQTHGFPFSLSGTLMEDPQQKGRMLVDLSTEAQSVPLGPLPWPAFLPFSKGTSDVHLKISGDPTGPLLFAGALFFRDISFALVHKTSRKVFAFPWLCLDLSGLFSGKTVTVDSFQMQGPSFNLRGESALDLVNLSDPRLYLRVEAPDMPVEIFKDHLSLGPAAPSHPGRTPSLHQDREG